MGAFEYLSVLISIIPALGMTRVLAGVGEMLQARSRRHIYWVHASWIVNLFLYLVVGLVDFLPLAQPAAMDVFLFVFVLISPNNLIWCHCYFFRGKAMSILPLTTRRIITRTIAPSLSSSLCLRWSISLTRCLRHPAFSSIRAAIHRQ